MAQALVFGERRIHSRKECTLFVDFKDSERPRQCSGHLRNIGLGGAFIETKIHRHYKIGQELMITIPYLLKSRKVVMKAKIVRIIWPNGMGIEFIGGFPGMSSL